jgi:hypothetical protein
VVEADVAEVGHDLESDAHCGDELELLEQVEGLAGRLLRGQLGVRSGEVAGQLFGQPFFHAVEALGQRSRKADPVLTARLLHDGRAAVDRRQDADDARADFVVDLVGELADHDAHE